MTARLSAEEQQIRSRTWLLHAEFAVAGHPRIANNQTDQIFPEYVRQCFHSSASYFEKHVTGLILLSFSLPTTLSSLCDREVVPVIAILYDSHKVCASTVEKVFCKVGGLTTRWAVLISRCKKYPKTNLQLSTTTIQLPYN